MSAAKDSSGETGGNVDRWLAGFRGEAERLRAAFDEARERSVRLGRGGGPAPLNARREPEPGVDRSALDLADRLVADAAAVARSLAERDGRVRALEAELARLRGVASGPEPEPDTRRVARDESDALRAERDDALERAAGLAREVETLRAELGRRAAVSILPSKTLPVLARDFARWSAVDPTASRPVAVAVAVGPPPRPPGLDDLDAVDHLVEAVRRLLHTPVVVGKPFHSLFDDPRLQALQVKLREAHLLIDRFNGQVERSRTSKEMLWHLMVARKTDELHRKRK